MSSKSEFYQFMEEYYPDTSNEERKRIERDAILSNDPKSKVVQNEKDKAITDEFDKWFEKRHMGVRGQ